MVYEHGTNSQEARLRIFHCSKVQALTLFSIQSKHWPGGGTFAVLIITTWRCSHILISSYQGEGSCPRQKVVCLFSIDHPKKKLVKRTCRLSSFPETMGLLLKQLQESLLFCKGLKAVLLCITSTGRNPFEGDTKPPLPLNIKAFASVPLQHLQAS